MQLGEEKSGNAMVLRTSSAHSSKGPKKKGSRSRTPLSQENAEKGRYKKRIPHSETTTPGQMPPTGTLLLDPDRIPNRRKTSEHVTKIDIRIRTMIIQVKPALYPQIC
jgi:hypothetical protein